jgi:hypothetical protein
VIATIRAVAALIYLSWSNRRKESYLDEAALL